MANLAYAKGRWMNLEKPGGAVFFVGGGTVAYEGTGASDTNRGLTPEEPLSTIDGTAGALAKVVAGRGDTIVVLPGSVTVTAAIAMDADDVTLTGFKNCAVGERPPSLIVSATDASMLDVSASNCVIENLTFDCNIATSTANNEVIQICDSATAQTRTGTVIRNCFFDMEGADSDMDVIRVGFDADSVAIGTLIEGCTLHDVDQLGIAIVDASTGTIIRNCRIYDGVTANAATEAVQIGADNTTVEECFIKVTAAASSARCISLNATAQSVQCNNNRLMAFGTGSIGIYVTATGTGSFLNNHISANALADTVFFQTAVTGNSGATGIVSAPADGTVCELLDPGSA